MPAAEILCRIGGLFAMPRFLDLEECRRLRTAMRASARRQATVRDSSGEFVVDPSARRVKWVDVPDDLTSLLAARLEDARPSVARHYGMALTGSESPQFLAYAPGDFYKPHRDNTTDRDAPGVSFQRRISAVVFLNGVSEMPADGAYGGGALTFYGLLEDPRAQSVGLPLDATEGLLMTFPADTVHGVAPVTHGERYTAVSWFR